MLLFKRGMFRADFERQYCEDRFALLEQLHVELVRHPSKATVLIPPTDMMERLAAQQLVPECLAGILVETLGRVDLIMEGGFYRQRRLLEGLADMHNSRNLLGWFLFGRAEIEATAFLNAVVLDLQGLRNVGNHVPRGLLHELMTTLRVHTLGTQVNWNALLRGEWKPTPLPNDSPTALNDEDGNALGFVLPDHERPPKIGNMLERLSKRPDFERTRFVYGLFSDFAHPNLGSQLVHLHLTPADDSGWRVALSVDADDARREFLMMLSLDNIAACALLVNKLLAELTELRLVWAEALLQRLVVVDDG
jgi:hypothetical protein